NTSPNPACPSGTCGVFTLASGLAPNRTFYIEWRATYFGTSTYVNFEVLLFESTGMIDFVYGAVPQGGSSATVGVQRGTGSQFTQYECNTGGLSTGFALIFTQPACPTLTPTITPTFPTSTPTATVPPCGPNSNYVVQSSTGFECCHHGTTDIG